jgi:hypothetical protein
MDGDPYLSAAIYVCGGPAAERSAAECAEYAAGEGWRVVAYVRAESGDDRWSDVLALLADGVVDVVVAPSRRDLPPDRVPRLVLVDEERRRQGALRQRRSRRIELPPR